MLHALSSQYAQAGLEPPSTLATLKKDDCRIVTVGHQLVLAGGPAFFHHKVLSAIRTARALSAELSIPVVPLFWMASEDHDWQEVAALEGETATHRWRPLDAETLTPSDAEVFTEGLQEVLSAWSSDLSKEGVVADVVEEFQKAQALGESLSGLSARRWLHRWYGHEGLLVFDADDASLKVFASHLWHARTRRTWSSQCSPRQRRDDWPSASEGTTCFGWMQTLGAQAS